MTSHMTTIPSSMPSNPPPALSTALAFITTLSRQLESAFDAIPGSAILLRYIRKSHQNDPWRTLLELALFAFAVRTILTSRTRTDRSAKNFVKLTDKEIDELVLDWTPEPLVAPPSLTSPDNALLSSLPVIAGPTGPKVKLVSNPNKTVINFASYNFTGLAEHEKLKEAALDTLRKYGVGTCGPSGFYGTIDVHQNLERELSTFLQVPSSIIYAQSFSCIASVIPSFAKRGDIIVADRLCNFSIQKGLQISRSTIKWYEHGDMSSLEQVLEQVTREAKRKGEKLTRRFIVTEGLFENDGMISDLEALVALKKKYKFRLILDESFSFGVLGANGRGLTELSGVPAVEVDMLVGSMATGLNAGGGFCAGSKVVTEHQRINSATYVFSASLPAMLATTSSTALSILSAPTTGAAIFSQLAANVRTVRVVLDKLVDQNLIYIPSDPLSPLIHIQLPDPEQLAVGSDDAGGAEGVRQEAIAMMVVDEKEIEDQERLLQEVVEEALASGGVLVTRTRRLRGQETFEARPSIKICLSASHSKKEVEKAVAGLKAALVKVLGGSGSKRR